MTDRNELLNDIKSAIIHLFFTFDDKDDIAVKQKIIGLIVDIIVDEIIYSEIDPEMRHFLVTYLEFKVEDSLVGKGKER